MKLFAIALAVFTTTSSAFACQGPALCAGDRAIDADDNIGTVKAVYSNGKATIHFDNAGGQYVREVQDLGKGLPCVRHICRNDRVVDADENVGRVREVFSNGKASVAFDNAGGLYVREVRDLKKGRRCVRHICTGSRVIDADDNVGTVREIFGSQHEPQAKIAFDGAGGTYIRNVRDLGRAWRCIGPACVGDAIMDSDENTGRIRALFSNGKVQVAFENAGGLYIREYSDLGLRLSCRPGEDCLNCRD